MTQMNAHDQITRGPGLPALSLLRESNDRLRAKLQERTADTLIESIKHHYQVDLTDQKVFDFTDPSFNWKEFRESAYRLSRRLREAQAESTFGQLLRAGIQVIANNWYQQVPVTYSDWIKEVPSNKRQEFYAPLHRAGFPRKTTAHSKFQEVKVEGLDIVIVNSKFGALIGFERELFDDDQTGQVSQRAADMGENMRVLEEIWVYSRFIGAATEYLGDPITASQTKPANETDWPWSASLRGGGKNRATPYVRFKRLTLINAWKQLFQQKDLLGNKMLVMPDTLIVSPEDHFDALAIMNSEWYPSVASATAGDTGQIMSKNVLKGLANVVTSRFMPDKAWAYGQAGKGMILQRRDPTEILQENPSSGAAFEQDEFRFRTRARWEPDWVDPRFWYLGDDGSV